VRLVISPTNVGFAAGCNLGIRHVDAHAYLLLNNDTLVLPGAIASLLSACDTHASAGVVAAQQEWPDGSVQTYRFRFPTPLGELLQAAKTGLITRLLKKHETPLPAPRHPAEADWVCFACALVRREVIEEVGLLDEGYFNYFDDVDYCRRVRQAGWRVLTWPQARVIHLVGKSQSVESQKAARKRRPRYYYESRARYFAKFYGRTGLWLANILWTAGRGVSLAREALRNKKPHVCEKEWLDIWTNWWNPLKPPARAQVKRQDSPLAVGG